MYTRLRCFLTVALNVSQLRFNFPLVTYPKCTSKPKPARKSHHRSKLQEITAGLAISEQITSPFSAIGAALALQHAFGSCHLEGVGAQGNHSCE